MMLWSLRGAKRCRPHVATDFKFQDPASVVIPRLGGRVVFALLIVVRKVAVSCDQPHLVKIGGPRGGGIGDFADLADTSNREQPHRSPARNAVHPSATRALRYGPLPGDSALCPRHLLSGARRSLISAPTGSGRTSTRAS